MKYIETFFAMIYALFDRTVGALIGQRCHLCEEFTLRKGPLRCCPTRMVSELRRWGL